MEACAVVAFEDLVLRSELREVFLEQRFALDTIQLVLQAGRVLECASARLCVDVLRYDVADKLLHVAVTECAQHLELIF